MEYGIETFNDEFLSVIFPPPERWEKSRTPLYANCLIYGHQGYGKTETVNWLIAKAFERYGEENVNAVMKAKDIKQLLLEGLDEKPVQILVCEDLTLQKVDDKALRDFYTVRHLAMQRGMKKGYILTIITLHDMFSVPKHIRTFFNFLIAVNIPANKFDYNILKAYFGEDILQTLGHLTLQKHFNDDAKQYKAFWFLGKAGFLKTELVNVKPKPLKEFDEGVLRKYGLYMPEQIKKFTIEKGQKRLIEDEEEEGMEWEMDQDG